MKVFPVLFPLIAIGTSVATPCCAQYHPAPTQAVAKRPHFSPPAVPGSRHGSIGGPAGKSGGIGGVANKVGGINGTVRPKYWVGNRVAGPAFGRP
jgi:hypothetical protein